MNTWEPVIGLEVHVQLDTQSKLFSGASTRYGAAPNTQACWVDCGLPGVLPVLNRKAVEHSIRLGLATDATIRKVSAFDRKNYMYPDLPKGYQISQFYQPIVEHGRLPITDRNGQRRDITIVRAHLEEDAGKSVHTPEHGTGVDLNRAGVPLLEIVSAPELYHASEAIAYLKALHTLVQYLHICDGNMQEGSFRCDVNLSLRPQGSSTLGTRVEIKNVNSFKFIEQAIHYEIKRQTECLRAGHAVIQETRLYDPDTHTTRSMRTKEAAEDYRYFPDPDLLPVVVSQDDIEAIRATLPELPEAKRLRFASTYGLEPADIQVLTASRALADYYEAAVSHAGTHPDAPRRTAHWITGELLGALHKAHLTLPQCPVSPHTTGLLIQRIQDGTISGAAAKKLLVALWSQEGTVDTLIAQHGLQQIADPQQLTEIAQAVLAAHPKQVAQYRAGKTKLFGFFVGQAMKVSEGKAHPEQLNHQLRCALDTTHQSPPEA